MSPYLAGVIGIVFIAWSGFMYYEGVHEETHVCGEANAKHDLTQAAITVAAEKGIITTVGDQQTVTQGVDNAYQAKKSDIDGQYAAIVNSMQPAGAATCGDIRALPNAAGRPHAAASRPFVTTVFKITPKECDENTEQLYGLQAWIKGQQAVKQPSTK